MQMPSEESALSTQTPPCVSEGLLFESFNEESTPSALLYSPISQSGLELCYSSSIDSCHEEVDSISTEDIQPPASFEDDHRVLTESVQKPFWISSLHSGLHLQLPLQLQA